MGPNGVPGSRRSSIWSLCACSSSTVSKAGAPSCAWRGCWNGGRISGRSDRATIGVGLGSAHHFLRCEIGRCGRPRAPRRNLGTRGLANMGARAAQNPESRHQVAVTRLDVHHTVGGSVSERLERVEHARTSVATHQRLRAGRDDRYSARAARIAGALTCVRMGWAWRAGQPGPGSCWPRHVWRLRFSRRRVAGAANGRRCAPGAGRSCRGHHRCRG